MIDVDLLKHLLYCDKRIGELQESWSCRYVESKYEGEDKALAERIMKHIEREIKEYKADRLLTLKRLGLSDYDLGYVQEDLLYGTN